MHRAKETKRSDCPIRIPLCSNQDSIITRTPSLSVFCIRRHVIISRLETSCWCSHLRRGASESTAHNYRRSAWHRTPWDSWILQQHQTCGIYTLVQFSLLPFTPFLFHLSFLSSSLSILTARPSLIYLANFPPDPTSSPTLHFSSTFLKPLLNCSSIFPFGRKPFDNLRHFMGHVFLLGKCPFSGH